MLRHSTPKPAHAQHGFALLEALIAILVLAIGVVGMLGVQLRTLAETQTGVHRAQAVRLIEDLSERIKSNSDGFAQLGSYQLPRITSAGAPIPPAPAVDCASTACNVTQLAVWDAYWWQRNVERTLPQGDAWVFLSTSEATGTRRQLGIMVVWHNNERSRDAPYASHFEVTVTAPNACPRGFICHLAYVQPLTY